MFLVLIVFCVRVVGTLCVVLVACVYHWFVVAPCSTEFSANDGTITVADAEGFRTISPK